MRQGHANFIANRVGIAGMLATMREAEQFGLSYDVVDDLTGKKLGRASGTFRTADVVGPGHDGARHPHDAGQPARTGRPFHASYATPPVLGQADRQGALGQKSGAGFYKKVGKDIQRLDPARRVRPVGRQGRPVVDRIPKKAPAERLKLLRESTNPQAQFLWAILRNAFHYAAVHLARDRRLRRATSTSRCAGASACSQGPFELWQAAGWQAGRRLGRRRTSTRARRSPAPLPAG